MTVLGPDPAPYPTATDTPAQTSAPLPSSSASHFGNVIQSTSTATGNPISGANSAMGTTHAANPATILIVEDEERLARLVADYLTLAGYSSHILGEGTGVVDWVRAHQPALVILDLMLPGRDGLDVCRDLRAFSAVPIIMTTARVEEIDRLLGLELGADDYLCKPFSPRELVARVKAVLRRFQAPPTGYSPNGTGASIIGADATAPARQAGAATTSPTGSGLTGATPASTSSTGLTGATPTPTTGIGLSGAHSLVASPGPAALRLDEPTLRVHWQGRTVELTAVEFSLLATLYASPGRIFSRNRLMALIYRDHRVVSDRTIDSHIKKLRRKLEELSTDQEWVHSVYGVGYRYEEQD